MKDTRILIVDDEPQYVWAIQANLEARGYEVYTADNGAAALEQVTQCDPDLVLLDVCMPEMDGFQTASMLKVRRKTKDIPIVCYSPHILADQMKAARMAGATEVLPNSKMTTRINKILGKYINN